MPTILIVCAVIITVVFVALAAQAILTLAQIRNTAKAVEYLALNADGKLTALDPIVEAVKTVSNGVSSGWFRMAQAVYRLFTKK
ncbi:MAG: hypothetical protein A2X34_03830 [Elusimicrobia bacterium GWC2_51_8]|nr:MAG: hypothetical protein A2X33_08335 [Elusimicrobia bacterium GWA2_51_34]OGR58937.1 MAG: hypothetical protein A2X34_03830 [Elusimicrobia bacterium GWC2_51_8]OGR85247.1 MAG: hypothetical protein A2021_02310 [Elusimicrobia bacterium GWF2_52_66]HAF95250.1 hypothetical protein [Elusimicrobiota bacterium]HCE97328.1 hypothetical protein [Elusimicrobiota bacterium]